MNCKRCGIAIKFDNGICINASTDVPHNISHCKTKGGYVYCPKHQDVFPQNNSCEHYKEYGYTPGQTESFFIKLIVQEYKKGSFLHRKNNRKSSQFDKLKGPTICTNCGKNLTHLDSLEQDRHAKECYKQKKIFA